MLLHDDLPLNKMVKLHNLTIIVRSVFEEDGKYYPQVFLDECLYESKDLVYFIFNYEIVYAKITKKYSRKDFKVFLMTLLNNIIFYKKVLIKKILWFCYKYFLKSVTLK